MPGNSLAPPSGSPDSHPLLDALDAQHQQAKAAFGKTGEANRSIGVIRSGLDSIAKLGEAVTSDDVVEEMGKLVGAGISPEPLIALIAGDPSNGSPPMPESGQALAAWVQGLEQKFQAQEGAIGQAHAQAQHQLGVSAAKVLLGHHIADRVRSGMGGASPPAASPQGPQGQNPLQQ